MQPTTLRLLAEAGLRGGDRYLDLGCGGGHVVLDMARIVGPDGLVTGVDFDPQIVELARQDAKDAGAGNVEYHIADAHLRWRAVRPDLLPVSALPPQQA